MRTLQEKYNGVLEGNFSKAQFVRDARMAHPTLVTQYNSYNDAVQILKNRGMIAEAKMQEPKYSTAKPEDAIAPDVLDTGIKFELDKKYGTLDVTDEQYAKCREMAIKNLAKDVLYYVKQDSIQLETPGEKMEKAKLNEGFFDRFKKKPNIAPAKGPEVLSLDQIKTKIKEDGIEDVLDNANTGVYSLENATEKEVQQFLPVVAKMDNFDHGREYMIANALRPIEAYKKFAATFEAGKLPGAEFNLKEMSNEETGPTGIALSQKQMDQLHDKGAVMVQVTVKDSDGSIRTVNYPLSYLGYEKDIDDTEDSELEEANPDDVNVDDTEKRTTTRDFASTPEKREDGTYDISGMMREAEAASTLADILKNKGSLDHLKKIERLRLKLIDGPFLQKNPDWKGKAVKFIRYDARERLVLIDLNGTSGFAYPKELVIDTETTNMSEDAKTQLKELFKKIIAKVITE